MVVDWDGTRRIVSYLSSPPVLKNTGKSVLAHEKGSLMFNTYAIRELEQSLLAQALLSSEIIFLCISGHPET